MPHHILFSDFSFHLIILPPIRFRREWNISLRILKSNSFFVTCCRNYGSQDLGVDLHGCTTLGVQSFHDLLKMQLLATVQCTVYADVDVVLWNSTFLHFIQHVLFFSCLLQCVYVYVCISVSLSFTSPWSRSSSDRITSTLRHGHGGVRNVLLKMNSSDSGDSL